MNTSKMLVFKIKSTILIFLLIISGSLSSQTMILSGVVKDITTNEPVSGVLLWVDNSDVKTHSDDLGNFSMVIPSDAKTLATMIHGYDDMVVPIGDKTYLTVVLMPLDKLNDNPLTGLSWSAPFIFWGGILLLALLILWIFRRRRKGRKSRRDGSNQENNDKGITICSNCRKAIASNSKFCTYCGSQTI